MPITPFHFGPGALAHAVAPRHVSFVTFCAANVLTDLETAYFLVTRQTPLHRFCHTYLGAAAVAAGTAALVLGTQRAAVAVARPRPLAWTPLTLRKVLLGAALGTSSHIVLDSVMHADIRPLAPFSDANALLGAVPLGALHWGCIASGVAGLAILGIRGLLRGRSAL